jgi:hypothetical protein
MVRKKTGKQNYSQQPKKYIGIKVIKEVKDFCNENYKTLKKKIEKDTRICKDFSCSCIGRINI